MYDEKGILSKVRREGSHARDYLLQQIDHTNGENFEETIEAGITYVILYGAPYDMLRALYNRNRDSYCCSESARSIMAYSILASREMHPGPMGICIPAESPEVVRQTLANLTDLELVRLTKEITTSIRRPDIFNERIRLLLQRWTNFYRYKVAPHEFLWTLRSFIESTTVAA